MPGKKSFNPFYAILVLAGIAFGVTALAYGAMAAIAQNDPGLARQSIDSGFGLIAVMDRHGVRLLLLELLVLAIATVLAISTDAYWSKVAAGRSGAVPQPPSGSDSQQQELPHENQPLRTD